jgi:hypothetical protein
VSLEGMEEVAGPRRPYFHQAVVGARHDSVSCFVEARAVHRLFVAQDADEFF